jgi:hypothetical protein
MRKSPAQVLYDEVQQLDMSGAGYFWRESIEDMSDHQIVAAANRIIQYTNSLHDIAMRAIKDAQKRIEQAATEAAREALTDDELSYLFALSEGDIPYTDKNSQDLNFWGLSSVYVGFATIGKINRGYVWRITEAGRAFIDRLLETESEAQDE